MSLCCGSGCSIPSNNGLQSCFQHEFLFQVTICCNNRKWYCLQRGMGMITGFWAAWAKAPSSDGSRTEARRPEETWRTRGEKNVIRHFKENPVKGKTTWRCQYRCNSHCLSHFSLLVPSIPVHPSMRPTALNSCCDCTLTDFWASNISKY